MPRKVGFSLVELLVVVAIIAILAALLVPSLGRVKELARLVACGSNLAQLGKAMESYTVEYDASYPGDRYWVKNLSWSSEDKPWLNNEAHVTEGVLWKYVNSIEAYVCPSWCIAAALSPHNHTTDFAPEQRFDYDPGTDRIVRSYVMNWNIGSSEGQKLIHKTQIRRPQDLGLFTEESPWWVYKDGTQYSSYIMNDACLVADGYPSQDCFGDFHLPPMGRRDEGFAQVVMLDSHVERRFPWETLQTLRQRERPSN